MRQIIFEADALAELDEWVKVQPKTASKILNLPEFALYFIHYRLKMRLGLQFHFFCVSL